MKKRTFHVSMLRLAYDTGSGNCTPPILHCNHVMTSSLAELVPNFM